MKLSVGEIARAIAARVMGDDQVAVWGVSSVLRASEGELVFVEQESKLLSALQSGASALVAGTFAEKITTSRTLLIASNPRLAFARAAEMLRDQSEHEPGIHSTAFIHPSAKLGDGISIGSHVTVHANVKIASRTRIRSCCVIGRDVEIGESCTIYPNVTIYTGTKLGHRVIVHAGAVLGSDGFGYVRDPTSGRHEKFPQVGTLEIEDDVEVGANTTIDRGALEITRIGHGTKIDNLVHIGHNCQIGENVIIAAQAGFSGSITIEDNVLIGGQVGVGEHARILQGVMLGGQSGVLPKKVLRGEGIAFWGTPAKPLRVYLKNLAALARLGRKE